MKKFVFGGFAFASALALGCADAKVKMDDVNGANAKGAKNAIFADLVDPTDIDGDGVDDIDVSVLVFVASDQDDLCGAIEADPDALANLPDIQATSVFVNKFDALGAGGFAEGDAFAANTTFNDFIDDIIAGNDITGTIFVDANAIVREGGTDIVIATTEGLLDGAALGDVQLELKKFEAGVEASAAFTGTLTFDQADAAAADTDLDGDGVNDVLAVNSALATKFRSVAFCEALIAQ